MTLASLIYSVSLAETGDTSSKSIPDQLGISLGNLIFQAIGFGILMFILWRFAYRPILKVLDERRARAQEIVEKSDQIKRDLSDTEARTRAELETAQKEAQRILADARAQSDRMIAKAREDAVAAGNAEKEKARAEITAERDQVFNQLRRETADLAITAATRVVGHELKTNKDVQSQLINEALANASKN